MSNSMINALASKCAANAGYRYATRRYVYAIRYGATAPELWRVAVGSERNPDAWTRLGAVSI